MRTLEKDYKYLLQNLIPFSKLPPANRRRIDAALYSGSKTELRREAVLALEELSSASYMSRLEPRFEEEKVTLIYSRKSRNLKLNVTIPETEWKNLQFDLSSKSIGVLESKAGLNKTISESSWYLEKIPGLIDTFIVDERNESLAFKLSRLCEHLEEWLKLKNMELFIQDEHIGESKTGHVKVHPVTKEEMEYNPQVKRMKLQGEHADFILKGSVNWENYDVEGKNMFMVSIFALGEFWGILQTAPVEAAETKSIHARVTAAARITQQMIENSVRLESMVSLDKLTGIYNRHFYDIQMPIEIERATRSSNKLSMILLDLDDFKKINDELGHKKGDEALVITAETIKKNLRKIDLPFRYGGEEFTILLPGTGHLEAIHTAERLRARLSTFDAFKDNSGRSRIITASFGIAVFPDHASTGDELFIKADKAMFRAKRLGKNRIELYID